MQEMQVQSLIRMIPWRRKRQPTPVFLPGKSHGRRSLVGYSPWCRKELDTTERLHFHFHTKIGMIQRRLAWPLHKDDTRICETVHIFGTSLIAQLVKNPLATQETWVRSLGWEEPLEKEMATHFSILAWEIPWTEEPGGLQSMGSQESDTT